MKYCLVMRKNKTHVITFLILFKHASPQDYTGGSVWTSSFGKHIVNQGRFEWKFLLKNIPDPGVWCIHIGIVILQKVDKVIHILLVMIIWWVMMVDQLVIIDVDEHTLSYRVNGKDLGVAKSEIKKGSYKAAVMTSEDDFEMKSNAKKDSVCEWNQNNPLP